MKTCSACGQHKKHKEFYKGHNRCKECVKKYQNEYNLKKRNELVPTERDPTNPRDAKEIAMKRMLAGAKSRALTKGLMFNLHYDDIQIPNLCPVLKIPLVPSEGMSDNSPSLDRKVPYLGYVKGNVQVISMKANRIKTDATSLEISQVLEYVKAIEEENT